MKKSNTLANIAATKQFEKKVLKNTKSQCMKESSTLANIATVKQLQKEILKNSKSQHIKESSTLAKISDMMNQLKWEIIKTNSLKVGAWMCQIPLQTF